MDYLLSSGPQRVFQPTGLLVFTDADIAELSDHSTLWAQCTVSGGRGNKAESVKGEKQNDYYYCTQNSH